MPQPNLLFFTCHDLGKHLSCYGHVTIRTPALQALADEGVRFDNVFCTAPQPFGWRLAPTERHLTQLLGEMGYATELVGMQHLIERGRAEELGYERVLPVAPAREEAEVAVERLRELAATERPFYL